MTTQAQADSLAAGLAINQLDLQRLALEAIANMKVSGDTDHAQLSALCIAIARATLARSS